MGTTGCTARPARGPRGAARAGPGGEGPPHRTRAPNRAPPPPLSRCRPRPPGRRRRGAARPAAGVASPFTASGNPARPVQSHLRCAQKGPCASLPRPKLLEGNRRPNPTPSPIRSASPCRPCSASPFPEMTRTGVLWCLPLHPSTHAGRVCLSLLQMRVRCRWSWSGAGAVLEPTRICHRGFGAYPALCWQTFFVAPIFYGGGWSTVLQLQRPRPP